MSSIVSILEGLSYNRQKEALVLEAVKVAYDDASKMKKSSRIIRKIFGRIVTPKEEWYDMGELMKSQDAESSPLNANYRSKFFTLNASYDDFPIERAMELLRKINNIPYDKILKILYKASKERFHIEQISNLRMIFQSDRNKNHRVELRFDRKLYNKDIKNDFEDEIEDPEDTLKNEAVIVKEKEERARVDALTYKDEDDKKAQDKKTWVRETMSNVVNPFKRDAVDEKEIKEKSGASSQVAKASSVYAEEVFDNSIKEEPDITRDVVSVVESVGGTMFGLNFRLKQPTSLGRKIATDVVEDKSFGGDVKRAADNIKDSVRYTAIFDQDTFTENYFETKRGLERLGYVEARCKNFFTKYAEGSSIQKAIQCVYFKKPDGITFEFQFHTVDSQGVKEVNHPLYEKARDKSTSDEMVLMLNQRMRSLAMLVPDPEGVFSIPEHS